MNYLMSTELCMVEMLTLINKKQKRRLYAVFQRVEKAVY